MYIEGLTVCVNYSDFLHRVLGNRKQLDRWVIVTTKEDVATRRLCHEQGLEVIFSSRLNEEGAHFNKGKVINDGLDSLSGKGLIALIDADTLLPEHFRSELEQRDLQADVLYGSNQRLVNRRGQVELFKEHSLRKVPENAVLGFMQIFNGSQGARYPEDFPTAAVSDLVFNESFTRREYIEGLIPTHFGRRGVNHKGRPAGDEQQPFRHFQVLGPYNSGTSLMERYLNQLFRAPVSSRLWFWKHSVLPNLHVNELDPDLGQLCVRHILAPADTLFVCMVRLPYFWLLTTLRRRYGMVLKNTNVDFSCRLRSPVHIKRESFDNPVQLWNHYYHRYIEHLESSNQVCFMRLEDLALSPGKVLKGLETVLRRKPGTDLHEKISQISTVPSKDGNAFGEAWKEKYRLDNVTRLIGSADLEFINNQLDEDLLRKFNYKRFWVEPEFKRESAFHEPV